jgi:predicted nucleotidyltransferase
MMKKLLALCKWPELSEKYDLALRSAVEFILENYSPVGIVAAGTIIRGAPDKSSDLDIYVSSFDSKCTLKTESR